MDKFIKGCIVIPYVAWICYQGPQIWYTLDLSSLGFKPDSGRMSEIMVEI